MQKAGGTGPEDIKPYSRRTISASRLGDKICDCGASKSASTPTIHMTIRISSQDE